MWIQTIFNRIYLDSTIRNIIYPNCKFSKLLFQCAPFQNMYILSSSMFFRDASLLRCMLYGPSGLHQLRAVSCVVSVLRGARWATSWLFLSLLYSVNMALMGVGPVSSMSCVSEDFLWYYEYDCDKKKIFIFLSVQRAPFFLNSS